MKKIILLWIFSVSLLLTSFFSHAGEAPGFSAFIIKDNLYITVYTRSCFELEPVVRLGESCREGKKEQDLAPRCSMELLTSGPKVGCDKYGPVVLTIDLTKTDMLYESRMLDIDFNGSKLEVLFEKPRIQSANTPPVYSIPLEIQKTYVGLYKSTKLPGVDIKIYLRGGNLFAQPTEYQEIPLIAKSDTDFEHTPLGVEVKFVNDRSFIFTQAGTDYTYQKQ